MEKSDPNLVQLDVYSCKPFDTEKVLNKVREFGPMTIGSKFLNRSIMVFSWTMFDEGLRKLILNIIVVQHKI